jgi:hypothetical protein
MDWKRTLSLIVVVSIVVITLALVFPPAIKILYLSELFAGCTFALLICFLPICYTSSELFSKLGMYHQLSNFNSVFSETGLMKLFKVYILELQLSLLIFIVIFFFAATIIQFKNAITVIDIINVIITSIVICPAFLLSLRLLANPVKKIPRWQGLLAPLNWILPIQYLSRPNANFEQIKQIKERIIAFYFSIITTVWFTLIIIYAYVVILWNTTFFDKVQKYFIPAIFSIDPVSIISLVVIFMITLFITSLIGETFLKNYEVIDINYNQIENMPIVDSLFSLIYRFINRK